MAKTMPLEIVTPDRIFFNGDVEMIVVTGTDGEIGILPEHINMAAALDGGPIRIKEAGQWREAFVSAGFIAVVAGSIRVLVQTAEWPEEIDERRAQESMARANKRMHHPQSHQDFIRARASIARAMGRLKVYNDTHSK